MQGANAIQQLPNAGMAEGRAPHDDVSILGVPDLEKLQLILDRSFRVHVRSHFFVWAQGILQALLPHEVLVCALAGAQAEEFTIDVMASAPLPAGAAEFLRQPRSGFIERLARNWKHTGRRPVVYQREACTLANADAQVVADVTATPFGNFAAHAMCGVDGSLVSLFVLINQPGAVGARQVYLLETLLPYLHVTWLRVHLGQPRAVLPMGAVNEASLLSAREIEVIRWVHDGKSNGQIGALLKISPLTVKNHVQKILRKLNVQNRTQAVAKSLALKILDSSRHA
jgi:transcriptional regulator EpsA